MPGEKYGDLAYWSGAAVGFRCTCLDCRRYAVLSIDDLVRRYGPAVRYQTIAEHLVCGGCGSRNVETEPHQPDPLSI